MEGRELAEFKNDVLLFMAQHGDDKLSKDYIFEKMPHPFDDSYELFEVLLAMIDEAPRYFDFDQVNSSPTWLCANDITQTYLSIGGFVNQYESDLEADLQAKVLERQEQAIKDLEERKLRTYWIPIVVSIIGLVVAIASYFKPSNNVTQEQLSKEVKTVQDSIQRLKTDFAKENDELKERLYKAEMLIAVYEDSLP